MMYTSLKSKGSSNSCSLDRYSPVTIHFLSTSIKVLLIRLFACSFFLQLNIIYN